MSQTFGCPGMLSKVPGLRVPVSWLTMLWANDVIAETEGEEINVI